MTYHIHTADGVRHPPRSLEAIRADVEAGVLKLEGTLVRAEGMTAWSPLARELGMPPLPAASSDIAGQLIPLKNGPALAAYYPKSRS